MSQVLGQGPGSSIVLYGPLLLPGNFSKCDAMFCVTSNFYWKKQNTQSELSFAPLSGLVVFPGCCDDQANF